MLLIKNQRFLKEYTEFRNKIADVSDTAVQQDLTSLLNTLVNAVKKIDSFHIDFAFKNPTNELTETRSEIITLRRKIFTKLKECEKAGLIKSNQNSL